MALGHRHSASLSCTICSRIAPTPPWMRFTLSWSMRYQRSHEQQSTTPSIYSMNTEQYWLSTSTRQMFVSMATLTPTHTLCVVAVARSMMLTSTMWPLCSATPPRMRPQLPKHNSTTKVCATCARPNDKIKTQIKH